MISDPRSDFKMVVGYCVNTFHKLICFLFKQNFEAIIGHNRSPVKKFWEELSLLQSYISILSNNNTNESTVINLENILDCDEIAAIINNIIKHVSLKEWSRKDLDLKNLRHEDILDKLWDTLKRKSSKRTNKFLHLVFQTAKLWQTYASRYYFFSRNCHKVPPKR